MARLCRNTAQFKQHAVESLILAIELFNRPHNVLRIEGVLFFLQIPQEYLQEKQYVSCYLELCISTTKEQTNGAARS